MELRGYQPTNGWRLGANKRRVRIIALIHGKGRETLPVVNGIRH
jgi:hypothetical protein